MIPKIIHYCWLSNDPVPQDLLDYMKTWKEKLIDYEFILWNFDRFDKSSSKWVAEAFDNKKYAFAADYIRLYALYNYGGIYMDMDIEVIKSFDPLLNSQLMLAYEDPEKSGIEAGCMGAEKGNSVIKECLDYYENRSFIKEDGTFDTLVLPKIMYSYVSRHPELTIYEKDFFTAKSLKNGEIQKTKQTYTVHHFAGSWCTPAYKQMMKEKQEIARKYKNPIIRFVLCKFVVLKKIIKDRK